LASALEVPAPTLCTLVDRAFVGPGWAFESKFDDLRFLDRFYGRGMTLLSRNNRPQEALFPEEDRRRRPGQVGECNGNRSGSDRHAARRVQRQA
jgi:hypothetical protein